MTSSTAPRSLRLGLIGGNITETRSPVLHTVCGLSIGRNATYDLIIPAERGKAFGELLADCEARGFDGLNITYPFKEEAAKHVPAGTPAVAAMGTSNTIKFGPEGPRAYNTDYSGFMAGFRKTFGDMAPGRVLMLGTGGVGRAVAFGLADLGARELTLYDTDLSKVVSLGSALKNHSDMAVHVGEAAQLADISGFDGVVNCTPLGMVGRPGSPLPEGVKGAPQWGFDAVYTPIDTMFRAQIEALGAAFMTGYELYFYQGIDAFQIFSGQDLPDPAWVRSIITHRPA